LPSPKFYNSLPSSSSKVRSASKKASSTAFPR